MSEKWGKFLHELVKEVAPVSEGAKTALGPAAELASLQDLAKAAGAAIQSAIASAPVPAAAPIEPGDPKAAPTLSEVSVATATSGPAEALKGAASGSAAPTETSAQVSAQAAAVRESGAPAWLEAVPSEDVRVDLDTIRNNPFQVRKSYDQDELTGLTQSIAAAGGLLQPIGLRDHPDGPQLIYGSRRLSAYRNLQFNAISDSDRERYGRIPAKLFKGVTDGQMCLWTWLENEQRSNCSPLETAVGILNIRNNNPHLKTSAQLAGATGLTTAKLRRLLRLAAAPAVVHEGISPGLVVPSIDPDDDRPANERKIEERRSLDLMGALAFCRLHSSILKRNANSPDAQKLADEETAKEIHRALRDNFGLREIEQLVEKVVPAEKAGRGRSRGRPREPFKANDNQLVIYRKRIEALSAPQKRRLRELLEPLWNLVKDPG